MKYSTGDIIETLDPRKYWSVIGVHDNMYYCKKLGSTRDDEVVSFSEYQVFTGFVQAEKGAPAVKPEEPATKRTNCEFCKHCIYVKEGYVDIEIKCAKLRTYLLRKNQNFICCKFKLSKLGKQEMKEVKKRNEK